MTIASATRHQVELHLFYQLLRPGGRARLPTNPRLLDVARAFMTECRVSCVHCAYPLAAKILSVWPPLVASVLLGDDYRDFPAVRYDVDTFARCNKLRVHSFPDSLRVPNTWAIQKPIDAPLQPRGTLGLGPNPYDPRSHCGAQGPPILIAQLSRQAACVLGESFGCYAGWPHAMWVSGGCRGTFRCSSLWEDTVSCNSWSRADPGHKYCECVGVRAVSRSDTGPPHER